MRKSILKIKEIVIEDKLYPRVKVSDRIIRDYVKDMKKGDVFPVLYVGLFKGKNYLIDGRHRLEAYRSLGEKYVQCEIKTNFTSFDDMFLAAFRANAGHGFRFNKSDKMKVAHILGEMKYNVGDISKLTGIKVKNIESAIKGKVTHILIRDKLRTGDTPEIIREKMPEKEKIKLVDDKEIKKLEEANKEEFQLYQLNEIYSYFKEEEFVIDNKKIEDLLRKIKKTLHKKYPKL